jgi:F-type H+-transporting ATPase subunit gamma
MASLRIIKRRIKSIKSINEITKAMEMISAVRFKRVEGRLRKSLPYTEAIEGLISRILTEEAVAAHPLFEQRAEMGNELLVVLTGDRGLCGSFNTNVLRRAESYVRHSKRPIEFLIVGKMGIATAKRRGWKVWDTLSDAGYKFTPESLNALSAKIAGAFKAGNFSHVNMLRMELSRGGAQKPVIEPFLNLRYLLEKRRAAQRAQAYAVEYIFEPDRATTLGTLIDLYVKQRVFITLLKSVAAEYSARMIAMKLASDNGKDLIKELTLERNKIRQAMITKEISEIIGGANALQ